MEGEATGLGRTKTCKNIVCAHAYQDTTILSRQKNDGDYGTKTWVLLYALSRAGHDW